VGYTCGLNEAPFAVIRARSEPASETASDDFAAKLDKVCQNSLRLLEGLTPAIRVEPAGENRDYRKASQILFDAARGSCGGRIRPDRIAPGIDPGQ